MDNITLIGDEVDSVSVSNSYTCSPETSGNYFNHSLHDLKILHTNIRSLSCNYDSLIVLMSRLTYLPDVIILTECWLSKCPIIPSISGFNSHISSFKNQNDGVVVYVRNCFNPVVETPILNDANCVLLKFSDKAAFLSIYRSPSYRNLTNFLISLDSFLGTLSKFNTVAIIGDLNINIAAGSTDPNADDYLSLIATHAMLPAYTLPTRLSSCLDHVVLRTQTTATSLLIDSPITDHSPVIIYCNLNIKPKKSNHTKVKTDLPGVVDSLSRMDFSSIFQCHNPNAASESLVSMLSSVINSHSHTSQIPSRKRIIKPWITPGLLRCIRHRDKLRQNFKKHPENNVDQQIFYRYRNFCNNLLKDVKHTYERSEFLQAKKKS